MGLVIGLFNHLLSILLLVMKKLVYLLDVVLQTYISLLC